jgi:hypothetical protein
MSSGILRAFGLAGLILVVPGACHSDSLGGTGGATGAGTGGLGGTPGTGGIIATGGTGGIVATGGRGGIIATGGRGGIIGAGGTGGFNPNTGGIPPEWGDGSVVPGIDCMNNHGVCAPDEFCGIVQINGNYAEHYCFSKGSCESCECLGETLSGFFNMPFNQTHLGSTAGPCGCSTHPDAGVYIPGSVPDAAASSVLTVECDNG